jgi:membrane protease YdiL (CAAX protease family)
VKRITETILVFGLASTAVSLIHCQEVRGGPVLIPAIWALGAFLAKGRDESVVSLFGLTRPQLALGVNYYLLSTFVIFPLYGGGFFLCHRLGMSIPRSSIPLTISLTDWIIYQFLFVGVFEELFFRGYIQTQVEKILSNMISREFWIFWLPILASAFLFGVAHVVVNLDPITFTVFFPGLLFGWLRAKTGSLVAPILSHGSANVFSMILIRSIS